MTRLDTLEDVYITNNKDVEMELLDGPGTTLSIPKGDKV